MHFLFSLFCSGSYTDTSYSSPTGKNSVKGCLLLSSVSNLTPSRLLLHVFSCYICFAHIIKWKIPLTCFIHMPTFCFSSFYKSFMQMFELLVQPYTLNCLLHFSHCWWLHTTALHLTYSFIFPITGKNCFKGSINQYQIS